MQSHRLMIALLGCVALISVTLSPVTAQQGHNPSVDEPKAATPDATTVAETGWQVADVRPLEIDGLALALSPDGAWLAGVGDVSTFCVWRMEDLEQTCVDTDEQIELNSLAWAPDSSAVAFSFDAFRLMVDCDLMVYDLADGALHNVTDDGVQGNLGFDDKGEPISVDVMPAWSADSQSLIFARGPWPAGDTQATTIASVPREGGEVTTLATLKGVPFAIFTPLKVLASGTVLYAFGASDISEPANGIWRLDPDGTTTQLISGTQDDDFPIPVVTDAWRTADHRVLADARQPVRSDTVRVVYLVICHRRGDPDRIP